MDLSPEFLRQTQEATNPHLAIEALRDLIAKESGEGDGTNTLRQQAFADRIAELMRKYTNQQLTSAEIIAELIAFAKDVVAEASRGATVQSAAGPGPAGLLRRRGDERVSR